MKTIVSPNYKPIMKLVMNELLIKNQERIENKKYCYNCGNKSVDKHSTSIFWCEYSFCSGRCRYDFEYDIRKGNKLS